jgi:hypothetical protein
LSRFLFSILFLLVANGAQASVDCFKNVPARTRVYTKWETRKYSFCTEGKVESIISESCAHGKNCEATKQRLFPTSLQAGLGGRGNPSFSTCEITGATATKIEIMAGTFKGQSLVICEFPDKSFINLTTWILKYVQYGLPAVPAPK